MNFVDINVAMCNALGLDPRDVTAMNIKVRPHQPIQVFIKRQIWSVETSYLADRFELVEKQKVA